MIYLIRRGLRVERYYRANFPIISGLNRGEAPPHELEGFVEKAGFYYLSVFPTVGFETALSGLLHGLTRQLKGKAHAKVMG